MNKITDIQGNSSPLRTLYNLMYQKEPLVLGFITIDITALIMTVVDIIIIMMIMVIIAMIILTGVIALLVVMIMKLRVIMVI